jgi:hypothetical protein
MKSSCRTQEKRSGLLRLAFPRGSDGDRKMENSQTRKAHSAVTSDIHILL